MPWLQDPDGDGTFTWATSELPAGDYTFKIAHDLATDAAGWYPLGAPAVTVSVPAPGLVVRMNYTLSTHAVTTTVTRPTTEPSLAETTGVWIAPGLIAWPSDGLRTDPSLLAFRLHCGAEGALRVDAEDITGGRSAVLRYDSAGLPAQVVQANPTLEGYLALRVPRATARKLPGIASATWPLVRTPVPAWSTPVSWTRRRCGETDPAVRQTPP